MSGRPALRYHGGKHRLAPWIIEHFPKHDCYVELFGGGASVLLQKERSDIEVYNDIDSEVVNFFQVLRDYADSLISLIELTPWSREEYERSYQYSLDPVENARRFFVRSWQGFGGIKHGSKRGWRYVKNKGDRSITHRMNNSHDIYLLADRLASVQIECDDWERVLKRFDTDTTLFYADPPYTHAERSKSHRKAYAEEWGEAEHLALLNGLKDAKGGCVISGYLNDLYENELSAWRCETREARTADRKTSKTEAIWIRQDQQKPTR